ncbi:MAG: hypothetical protein K2H76_07630, partial [Muribaculaceae bacterium]|nr:hypothetical protein [Muribaculaceae bacterium]
SFTMVETRFDKIQTQVDETDKDVENIKENLTNSFTAVNAEIDDLKGQVENLNNVAAVTRANEEAIETLSDGVSNLEELTGENGRLMTLIKELQNQIATLQEEVKALKGE